VIARDAKAEKVALTLIGGEALLGADPLVPMTDGVEAIALPDYQALPEGETIAAAMKEKNIFAEGYVLPAHAAVTVLAMAASRGGDLATALSGEPFPTALGTVAFGADHELRENPYRLLVWRAGAFVPAEAAPESE
jgi:branched-chain amino acid transport system substrate-binding protein